MINVTLEQLREMVATLSETERAALVTGISDEAIQVLTKLFPSNPVIQALISVKLGV